MSGSRWGPEGPPKEAYSRVTNPERFAPLHDFAINLLANLEAEFDVQRSEGYDLDPELEAGDLARPSVKLTPRSNDAAPILVVFTDFPAVLVHAGRWHTEPVPDCGCDACDETAESAIHRLSWLVENVAAGHFREAIKLPRVLGDAWQTKEIGQPDSGGWSRGSGRVRRARARKMLEGSRSEYDWKPWPRR